MAIFECFRKLWSNSQCTQITRNLRRDIEVANRQVNHIGKVVQTAISGGSIFDNFDDPVKALPDGVGQIPVDIGENILEVVSQGSDKLTQ